MFTRSTQSEASVVVAGDVARLRNVVVILAAGTPRGWGAGTLIASPYRRFVAPVIHTRQGSALPSMLPAQNRCMGIRYYADAFDSDQTGKSLADPLTVIGSDQLADAYGFEPGFRQGVTLFRQSLPERDFNVTHPAKPEAQFL